VRARPSGDLYVTVHVRPDKVFGRDGDDLTVTVPVSFTELALGTTLSVPTLDGKVGVQGAQGRRPDPAGPWSRGAQAQRRTRRPVGHREGRGAVGPRGEALEALEAYAAAERASGFDPRAGWGGIGCDAS
jgi:molecular chaperone DnaJ